VRVAAVGPGKPDGATGAAVDLYWIPLGAGGRCVAANGRVFEALAAAHERRPRYDLYHTALVVHAAGERYAIELGPSAGGNQCARGVVGTGAVGSRPLGRLRLFRYEVRCARAGSIPDLDHAVVAARLSTDPRVAATLVELVRAVPRPVWGRDELNAGEMWNSNSVVAWLIASAGLSTRAPQPPAGGRAPGWDAGLRVAARAAGDGGLLVVAGPPPLGGRRATDQARSRVHPPASGALSR
jgi:hypothetical protein